MSRDAAIILDMRRAAQLVAEFVRGMDGEAFAKDLRTQSAVLHQLMVLGEAANRLSDGLTSQHPEMPWRVVVGMRNRLIHGYDDVDLDEVWNTATRDLPRLLSSLLQLDVDAF